MGCCIASGVERESPQSEAAAVLALTGESKQLCYLTVNSIKDWYSLAMLQLVLKAFVKCSSRHFEKRCIEHVLSMCLSICEWRCGRRGRGVKRGVGGQGEFDGGSRHVQVVLPDCQS